MIHSAHDKTEETRVAELKRLITSRQFDSLEMLEDAVDDFLWGDGSLVDGSTIDERRVDEGPFEQGNSPSRGDAGQS